MNNEKLVVQVLAAAGMTVSLGWICYGVSEMTASGPFVHDPDQNIQVPRDKERFTHGFKWLYRGTVLGTGLGSALIANALLSALYG